MHSEGIEIMLPEYLPPFVHKNTCGGRPGKADCVQWCNRTLGGWVEVWHIPRKTTSEWGFYSMQPQIMQWLSHDLQLYGLAVWNTHFPVERVGNTSLSLVVDFATGIGTALGMLNVP